MLYLTPVILIISIWIAITDRSWRPFCLPIAFFSVAEIIYAGLKSVYSFHWETNTIYYISQDIGLLVSLWAVNRFFKPIEYSESKNFAEPALMFIFACMVIYRAAKWVGSTFPFREDSIYLDIFTIIHYNLGVAFATLNTIVILLLLLGGGFYGKIWRIMGSMGRKSTRSLVYNKLSNNIFSRMFHWGGLGSLQKREAKK